MLVFHIIKINLSSPFVMHKISKRGAAELPDLATWESLGGVVTLTPTEDRYML